MKKHSLFFILLGIFSVQLGFAQQKTITGTVTDENGVPLPGATALIENTTRGVTTDFDGNFTIEVEANEVLIISYIGYSDQKITIGPADTYDISLQPGNQLEEVVVTSLGISREKKSLGYAQQSVQGETLVQSKEVDLNVTLAGKVAGVQMIGGSSSTFDAGFLRVIIIAGIQSLQGIILLYIGTPLILHLSKTKTFNVKM